MKPCIDINRKLKTKSKADLKKYFFEVTNNSVFQKTRKCKKT